MILSVVSAWIRNLPESPSLYLASVGSLRWPLVALIQPFSEEITVMGSLSIIASMGTSIKGGGVPISVRLLPIL